MDDPDRNEEDSEVHSLDDSELDDNIPYQFRSLQDEADWALEACDAVASQSRSSSASRAVSTGTSKEKSNTSGSKRRAQAGVGTREKQRRMDTIGEAVCKFANEQRPNTAEDVHETFGKYIAQELRCCPDLHAVALCKSKILLALNDMQFGTSVSLPLSESSISESRQELIVPHILQPQGSSTSLRLMNNPSRPRQVIQVQRVQSAHPQILQHEQIPPPELQ